MDYVISGLHSIFNIIIIYIIINNTIINNLIIGMTTQIQKVIVFCY